MKKLIILLLALLVNANASMVKMQNDDSWNMAHDKIYIYALTRNYEQGSYKIEIYDKKSLKFVKSKQLSITKSFTQYYNATYVKIPNKPNSIEVGDKYIYIGTVQDITFYDKKSLNKVSNYKIASPKIWDDEKEKNYIYDTNEIGNFTKYKNYVIAYGKGDNLYVFKDDKIVRIINIKKDYPKNIAKIHEDLDVRRINSVLVHNNRVYTGNWRGFLNIYDLNSGEFLDQISTIEFNKEYGYVTAKEVNYIALYKDRWIYMALDYDGLMILDTKTKKLKNVKTLFEKQRAYSEILKKYYDNTQITSIYRMVFYKDNLIFSEVNKNENYLYVYNLKTNKIVDTFKKHTGDITSMFTEDDKLFGLSSSGYIYKWDLQNLK
ncbi:hypothetical protein [Candidatus Sulfurimonas baltica]|uniref:WD40 repeat domain-containing protein n=1 Tax=Candidatus Sulfurimonas baltica TaxID=2740404 RepID=A0A7S7LXN3_9BACT|nr:hypothetical protein [Candidatus Sulfurimonas baltica]QOY53378.1 hypothetical protein HUE88_06825 [Candidatus Sulfurimonas baltica]